MINERNRQDFQHALSDPNYLQEQIESEETFKGRSMQMNRDELFKSFASLDTVSKRRELGRELSELYILIYQYIKSMTMNIEELNLDEFLNLYDGNLTEDEYLNGYYEDFVNFKELLAIYLDKINNE